MNVQETEQFWQDREAHFPHELPGVLRDFSREAHTRGELVLCGTLRTAAERLERRQPRALEDRGPVRVADPGRGLTTTEGADLEGQARSAPAGFRYISEDRRRAELDRRAEQRGQDRRAER